MADFSVTIKVSGSREFMSRFQKFGATILNLGQAMNASGKYLSQFFSGEVFASRGQIVGKPWQPLSASYAALKARRFPGRPPLIRSGAMNRGYKFDAKESSVFLFNDRFYFRFHQNGEGVPQRVTMDVDAPRAQRVGEFIADNIGKNMESAGV
ncbi:phage virion morphogenesis protein [Curtobacterium sp. MCSS17_007]|uniref:phage virion morphogenesis protein n=1 Tax=Curtobacterium sp. MCSS17_007 TaxID=2175646 RepID=UPI000DA8D578|nr:phage virion morphogenesis protein [Curtobacterium sp. MCSS17_007]WIE74486.1 phage virion morphogenesis protein [Curtobacterium sp. MCSS17_007]